MAGCCSRWGLIGSAAFVLLLLLASMLHTHVLYVIPYRDMVVGVYPPSRILDLLVSPWSPENFGQPSSLPMTYLVLYAAEKVLPPVKAFLLYTWLPYLVAVIVAYYVLRYKIGFRDELLTGTLALLASINWFTLYSFGSTYVVYTYTGLLLGVGVLYAAYVGRRVDEGLAVVELAFAMLLSLAGWNLPGLMLFMVPFTWGLFLFAARPRMLLRLLLAAAKALLVVLLIASPFIYSKIFGLFYYGFHGYSVKAGYIPVGRDWLSILMPRYFQQYLSNILKIFMLPFDPLMENRLYIIVVFPVLALIAYTLANPARRPRRLRIFYLYHLLYVVVVSVLIAMIIRRSPVVNTLYSKVIILPVLKTATNYMTVLVPVVLFLLYLSLYRVNLRVARAAAVLILVFALASNNLMIIKIINIDNTDYIHVGGYNYKVYKIDPGIANVFEHINRVKNWHSRAIWLPLYPEERSMFTSVFEDIPISKSTDKKAARLLDALLTNLLAPSSEAANLTKTLLKLYGIRYVVVVKNVCDNEEPRIVYYGASPVGIIGDYNKIIKTLDHKNYLVKIYDDRLVTIYRYNYSSIFNKLISLNRNNIQNNITIKYKNINLYTQMYKNLHLRSGVYKLIKINKTINNIGNLTISALFRYDEVYSLYGNLVKLFGNIRILVRKNGKILFQVHEGNRNYNCFSSRAIEPHETHHILAVFNNGSMKLFIDGIYACSMKVRTPVLKPLSNSIVIGSYDGYNIDVTIYNIDVFINSSINYERLLSIYSSRVFGLTDELLPLKAHCTALWSCKIASEEPSALKSTSPVQRVLVSSHLPPFWEVEGNGKLVGNGDFTILTYTPSREGSIALRVGTKFMYMKAALIVASIASSLWLVLRAYRALRRL